MVHCSFVTLLGRRCPRLVVSSTRTRPSRFSLDSSCRGRVYSSTAMVTKNTTNKDDSIAMIDKSIPVLFVGLGNMGFPMAQHLHEYGLEDLVVYDVNETARNRARDCGMTVSDDVHAHLFTNKKDSVTITMLPGCDALTSTLKDFKKVLSCKEQNIQSRHHSSKLVIDCSTVQPATSRYWHKHWVYGGFLDAPVSGGVKGATDGTLTFMVGATAKRDRDDWYDNAKNAVALEQARPYLQVMGSRIVECGGPGAGSAVKLCNNLALAAQMIGICEAMNLGDALEVDPKVLADVMNTATAKCWSSEVNNPHPAVAAVKNSPAANHYQGGFGSDLMLKDLGLAMDAAKDAGVALPLTSQSKELYRLVSSHGLGQKDFGVMLQFLRGNTNV